MSSNIFENILDFLRKTPDLQTKGTERNSTETKNNKHFLNLILSLVLKSQDQKQVEDCFSLLVLLDQSETEGLLFSSIVVIVMI